MAETPLPDDIAGYLDAVPGERGVALRSVFSAVDEAMPAGYERAFDGRFITWEVPLSRFSPTYNGQPLQFAGVAAQKNYNALYLNGNYSDAAYDAEFRQAWAATGRRLDMGKTCLRFRVPADVDLGLVERAVADFPVERFLDTYARVHSERSPR